MRNKTFEEKFWSKVNISDDGSCWEWNGAKRWNGYGKFTHNKKTVLAHRASYEIKFGKIENGFVICHKCDNRSCVNPNHLWKGTQLDNILDMVKKQRHSKEKPRGSCELHPRAKITNLQAREILKKYHEGNSSRKLGLEYGISKTMILNIVNNKNWKHLDNEIFAIKDRV